MSEMGAVSPKGMGTDERDGRVSPKGTGTDDRQPTASEGTGDRHLRDRCTSA
jgi:hypothetical protein